jgi:hypothetical protein
MIFTGNGKGRQLCAFRDLRKKSCPGSRDTSKTQQAESVKIDTTQKFFPGFPKPPGVACDRTVRAGGAGPLYRNSHPAGWPPFALSRHRWEKP